MLCDISESNITFWGTEIQTYSSVAKLIYLLSAQLSLLTMPKFHDGRNSFIPWNFGFWTK